MSNRPWAFICKLLISLTFLMAMAVYLLLNYFQSSIPGLINPFLKDSSIQITSIEHLQLGWQTVSASTVVLEYQGTHQQVQRIKLNFSKIFTQLNGVDIYRLELNFPQGTSSVGSPILTDHITGFLSFWHQLPAFKLAVNQLMINKSLYQLSLSHQGKRDSLKISQGKYVLGLEKGGQGQLIKLEYGLFVNDKRVASGKAAVGVDSLPLELNGNLTLKSQDVWQDVSQFIHSLEGQDIPLPELVSGEVNIEVNGQLDINQIEQSVGTVTLRDPLNLSLKYQHLKPVVNVDAKLTVAQNSGVSWKNGALSFNASEANVSLGGKGLYGRFSAIRCEGVEECELEMEWQISLTSEQIPQSLSDFIPMTFESLKGALAGHITLRDEWVDFSLNDSARFTLENGNLNQLSARFIDGEVEGGKLSFSLSGQSLQVSVARAKIAAQGVKQGDKEVSTQARLTDIEWTKNKPLQSQFQLDSFSTQSSEFDFSPFALDGEFRLDKQQVSLTSRLTGAGIPLIHSQIQYQLDTLSAKVEFELAPVQLPAQQSKLRSWITQWPATLKFLSGNLTGNGQLSWQNNQPELMQGIVNIELKEVAGIVQKMGFHGGRVEIPLEWSEGQVSADNLSLALEGFDVGFPITNVEIDAKLDDGFNSVLIHLGSANLLGGQVKYGPFRFYPNGQSEFELVIAEFQLKEILALINKEEIMGQASISGRLPLKLEGKKLTIDGGKLGANGDGVIRYQTRVQQTANLDPTLKLVNDALSNYHFDKLETLASYDEDGELLLNMKLEGANPDMNNGQKINLNLNVSNNIPLMLKSLQLGREIVDVIDKEYNKEK